MKKWGWILIPALAAVFSLPVAASQGRSPEKTKPEEKGKPAEKAEAGKSKPEKDKEWEEERERQAAQGRAFGREHEKIIREWFGTPANLQGLPPGLAKRDELPPGLQRHLVRNGTLPPGLQKRWQPLPHDLEMRLPKIPEGLKRGTVAESVVIVEERTSKILDIIDDVMGGGKAEGSTGVRRTRDKF